MQEISVPNVSEGRDKSRLDRMIRTVGAAGAQVLDVHSDPIHHRSVLTLAAASDAMQSALTKLAVVASEIRLDRHSGVHPRLGGLDVCPLVADGAPMDHIVELARSTGESIYRATGLPVYFYGEAALRQETRELRDLRRGGLEALSIRAQHELPPDLGGPIDPVRGVVCIGARGPLIAFNVNLRSDLATARAIAASVREASGGLPGVRALAWPLDTDICQVSMNLTQPERAGIDEALETVATAAKGAGAEVVDCEVVGLVPERFLPDPQKEAARLLKQPGRSLEARLRSS